MPLLTTSSSRCRYISKIIFTSILGYPVDIGHMEAVNLISSTKYSEKQIVRSFSLAPRHLQLLTPPSAPARRATSP